MIKFEAWCNCEGTGVMPVPFADMYMICKFCDGVGTITIQEEEMEEESNSNPQISQEYLDDKGKPFAYEEYVELKKTYQELRDKSWEQRAELMRIRDNVRTWFQERYEESDYSSEFQVDVDDVNALLSDINASELEKVYEASATIELTIRVHAENKDDAESIIDDHLTSIDFGAYGGEDEYEVESIDVRVND